MFMKRAILVLLSILMIALAGCGADKHSRSGKKRHRRQAVKMRQHLLGQTG